MSGVCSTLGTCWTHKDFWFICELWELYFCGEPLSLRQPFIPENPDSNCCWRMVHGNFTSRKKKDPFDPWSDFSIEAKMGIFTYIPFFLFQFKVKERISILFRWLQSPYILPLAPISSYFFSRVSKSSLQTCFETNNASVSCKPFTKAVDYYYTAVVISNQSLGWLVVN